MENLTFTKMLDILRKNSKVIFLFTVAGLAIGIFYAVTFFQPIYKTTVKLLIKDLDQQTFITDFASSNKLDSLSKDGNPALTQIQILTSGDLSSKVWKSISSKYKFQDNPKDGAEMMQKAINVENPVGTDILEVTSSWSDPKISKDIASEFVNAYIGSNIDISKKGLTQSKNAISNQLDDAQKNLAAIREQIKDFRQAHSTIDLQVEAGNIVDQISGLQNRYNDVASSAVAEGNRASSIAGKLGIDWQSAINSVALGHNSNVMDLQSRLGQAQEELAGLSSKYSPTHPAIIALNSTIKQIRSEIADQIKQTIGLKTKDVNSVISDPVRTGLMSDLATSEATYRGLSAQADILRSAISMLQSQKSTIPNKQLVLSNLIQQETNWSNIVNTLQAKLAEAKIREAQVVSNISIIDNAVIPTIPAFPTKVHVVILLGILGFLIGTITSMLNHFSKDSFDNIDQIEEETLVPVLGVVPWLDNDAYNESDALINSDDATSFYTLSYQKILSSLKIRGYNSRVKTLTFTSTEFSKFRSSMVVNLAYELNKTGQSVIIVDTDFRTPTIHKEFGFQNDDQFNLAELITNISKEISENGEFNWKYLSYFLHDIPKTSNFQVILNNGNVNNPHEFLHSSSFSLLIQKLREQYDWVLLDAPPAMAVSDAITISSYTDSVVLITGISTTKSMMKKVLRLFANHHISIFGIIARELQTKEAIFSNKYIKQMISRMIPENDSVFVDK